MQISNDRYFRDRQRHDLALRMIRHEARTCTIKCCTGLTDDRIRRLHKALADLPIRVRRRRGKSPRQIAFFTRNARMQFESSFLASVFTAFGLTKQEGDSPRELPSIEFGELFCDAYETHMQLLRRGAVTFEHAWFLLQLLDRQRELKMTRCRRCQTHYLRDLFNITQRTCPTCELKTEPSPRSLARQRSLAKRLSHAPDPSKEAVENQGVQP
jgi:hypothetical protein